MYMSSNNSGRNRTLVPEAKAGLNRLKTEVASEVGLSDYENIDKGSLSSRQNGYVGGYMVKHMIQDYEQGLK
jgi:Small, acid-soluble spore proteins, alpha/beta type.